MPIERIFDIQWFDWGEADDIYKWPANSFYAWENIEVRKDLSWIQLSSVITDTWYTFDAWISYMIHSGELWGLNIWLITCLTNGKIYLGWTLKYTLNTWTSAWDRITWIGINFISWVQYYYMITESSSGTVKIHKFNSSLVYQSTLASTITVQTWTLKRAFTISSTWNLYIALMNKVYVIDSWEVLEEQLELPSEEYISWFTEFQDTFKIYTNKQNIGVQYVWDWVNTTIRYRQEWVNLNIMSVTNDWAYDYALLWFNSESASLYKIAWTQKQEFRVNLDDNANARILWAGYYGTWAQFITNRQWIIYISGKTKESANYWVFTYGNYYPWASLSLTQSYTWTTKEFLYTAHSTLLSYIADDDNSAPKVYKVSHENPPAFWYADWYVTTEMYQWISWEDKELVKIKIWFRLETGSSFNVYWRTSIWDSWTLIKEVDNATYGDEKRILIAWDEILSSAFGTFNEIQFKISLIAGTSDDYTPIITRFTAYMNVLNND